MPDLRGLPTGRPPRLIRPTSPINPGGQPAPLHSTSSSTPRSFSAVPERPQLIVGNRDAGRPQSLPQEFSSRGMLEQSVEDLDVRQFDDQFALCFQLREPRHFRQYEQPNRR